MIKTLLTLALPLALIGCTTHDMVVEHTSAPGVPVSAFDRYHLEVTPTERATSTHWMIEKAIHDDLRAKGYRPVDHGSADVLVRYALAVAPELTMPRDYTAPVKATSRATMSEAAAMRAATRATASPSPERGPLYELAGRRLADYQSGSPTSVVHMAHSSRRVRTVLRAGGASDLVVDRDRSVAHHVGIPLGWLAGGASDLVTRP